MKSAAPIIKNSSKNQLHPNSFHHKDYNFESLCQALPALKPFVFTNKYGTNTIDFANNQAVKQLNKALLAHFYKIHDWQIPEGYLVPPIPGRVDYLHYVADLISQDVNSANPNIRCIDIGIGANCIYPLVGASLYNWQFTGTEIDEIALEAAKKNVAANPKIASNIELKQQYNSNDIYYGTVRKNDFFELSICNPPFHASAQEALAANQRKVKNLGKQKTRKSTLNFGGTANELWCQGGEKRFVLNMMRQSAKFKQNILWFTTLVSKESHLGQLRASLNQYKPADVKTIEMGQGNKKSRILAWTFFNEQERNEWLAKRK